MSKVYSIEELKSIIVPIAINHGVKKVALFGSYSQNRQNEYSDVDLLIDKGEIRGLIAFNKFANDISDSLSKKVDIITYHTLKKSLIADTVEKEIVLYEQP